MGIPELVEALSAEHDLDDAKVVYSKEPPLVPADDMTISCRKQCFVPSVVWLIIAGK